jgi:hypothetical protein
LTSLRNFLERAVESGTVPGAAAGTSAHIAPPTATIGILLTQLQMTGPTPTQCMREFWQYAFGASA